MSTTPQTFREHLETIKQDGIIWKSQTLWQSARADPDRQQKAVEDISAMLLCINQPVKRDTYIDLVTKALKLKAKWLKDCIANFQDEEDDRMLGEGTNYKIPAWADRDRILLYGFDWQVEKENTGYWFAGSNGELRQLTNFVISPLFHIYDRTGGNRRLSTVNNGLNGEKVLEMPSKAFTSLDKFEELLLDEGYYTTLEGFGKPHLKRLFKAIGNNYPKTYELKFLGWQPEGFWSYSDAIFDGDQIIRFNDIGIAEYKKTFYYSPASSSIYKSDRKDEEGLEVMDDDPYENDKYLRYHVSPVTFSQWCQHMVVMHKQAAMPLIGFAIVSLFKDVIVNYEKCPILYGYGLVQSGKSTWAEALYYLFHSAKSKPFNLNQGTVYAFFNRMERFRNCPQLFNEFDEDTINEEFFRAFKASYDGEGRDKGKGIKGKTETQKINCTPVIVGQTLTTKDGASVLIRSVPVKFNDPGDRSDEEKRNYDTWFSWVQSGLNGCLTEVLRHRRAFKEEFFKTFNEQLTKLKAAMRNNGESFKERIAKNYCILLASTMVIGKRIPLGFTDDEMFEYCRHNIISLSRMISEVDNLAIFWKTIEFLHEMGMIQEGTDFKLVTENSIKKQVDKEVIEAAFDAPTTVLYIRLVKVFPLFQEQFRKQGGKNPVNERTLVTYFESSKPFLGMNKTSRFGDKVTNSYMFKYNDLKINLEREITPEDKRKAVTITGNIKEAAELKDVAGKPLMAFSIYSYEQQKAEGNKPPQTITLTTKCFTADMALMGELVANARVKLTGLLDEREGKGGYKFRSLDVTTIELLNVKATSGEFDEGAKEQTGF